MPSKIPLFSTSKQAQPAPASAETRREDAPLFKGEAPEPKASDQQPWKLLVVDDEPEVHSITRMALSDFRYRKRGLEFISAYSGEDARQIMENDPEIAVILLDVVMETDDAGLKVVQYVRQHLGNRLVRIILRTGHPGLAPERRVIEAYDINDYRAKTELTQDRMFSLMHTSLAAYQHLISLAQSRRQLASIADEYKGLLERIGNRLSAPAERVRQSAGTLKQVMRHDTPPDLLGLWDHLDDGAGRIELLSRALAQLSRLSLPEQPQTDFDGAEAMQEVLERCRDLIDRTGGRVEIQPFPLLRGYREPFLLMMEHLLRNALLYRDRSPAQVSISIEANGQDWQITVADRGCGIPADRLEEIFQPFIGSPSGEAVGREGLGLVLCRKIAAMHGGKIWAEVRAGGGTRIVVKLPAQSGAG